MEKLPSRKKSKKKFGGAQEGAGRPSKEIDWNLFEKLCSIQCTQSEMASCLKVDEDTLRLSCNKHYKEEFSVIYKRYSESGKCSLRRYQFIQSKDKPGMAIWLGKQWLGQVETQVPVNSPNHDMLQTLLSVIKEMKGKLERYESMELVPPSEDTTI